LTPSIPTQRNNKKCKKWGGWVTINFIWLRGSCRVTEVSGSSHLDGKSRKTALRGWSHVTRKTGSAELRREVAESRRVKPENLCGSQQLSA